MYKKLVGKTIDKTNPDYKDLPEQLDGHIYLSGDKKTGWETQKPDSMSKAQSLAELKAKRKAEIREEWINEQIAPMLAEVDAATTKAAVRLVTLKKRAQ